MGWVIHMARARVMDDIQLQVMEPMIGVALLPAPRVLLLLHGEMALLVLPLAKLAFPIARCYPTIPRSMDSHKIRTRLAPLDTHHHTRMVRTNILLRESTIHRRIPHKHTFLGPMGMGMPIRGMESPIRHMHIHIQGMHMGVVMEVARLDTHILMEG